MRARDPLDTCRTYRRSVTSVHRSFGRRLPRALETLKRQQSVSTNREKSLPLGRQGNRSRTEIGTDGIPSPRPLFRGARDRAAAYPFIEEGNEAVSFRFSRRHVLNHTRVSKKQKREPVQRRQKTTLLKTTTRVTRTAYFHVSPRLTSTVYCTSNTVKAKGFFSKQNFTNALPGSSKIKLNRVNMQINSFSNKHMYFTTVGSRFKMLLQTVKTQSMVKAAIQKNHLRHVAD